MRRLRAYLAVPVIGRGVMLAIFALALLAATESWFWAPARDAHAVLKAQVVALQSDKATLEARVNAIDNHARMADALDRLTTRLAAPVDRSAVVERLTEISSQAGTRIIHGANSFGRPIAAPDGEVRPVLQDLTVEGSYAEVGAFLNALAQIETLTLLRGAEFSANPDGTLVRVQMKLVTLSTGAAG